MDWFDFLPIGGPEGAGVRRKLTREEHVASGVVAAGLPVLDLCLVMFAGLTKHPGVAILWLPLGFVALGALICRRLRVRTGYSIALLLTCGFWCFMVGACLVAMEIFILPW